MTTTTRSKNLREFQKTRRFCADLRQVESVADVFSEEHEPVPGFLYEESFYIEIRNGAFYTVLECMPLKSFVLESIEKDLFEYSQMC